MLARVSRYEVGADSIAGAAEAFGEAAKAIEQLDGFAGGYVLVDHEDGRTMTVTLWENQAALEASESVARGARNSAADAVGGSVLSVEKFDGVRELKHRGDGA
jgi:heme-degrading monooxygenase HmoA